FFFSSRRRHTRFSRDWSSDVCSSDLCNGISPPGGLSAKDKEYVKKFYPPLVAKDYVALKLFHAERFNIKAGEQMKFTFKPRRSRSEERRVGKESRARWSQDG